MFLFVCDYVGRMKVRVTLSKGLRCDSVRVFFPFF